MLDEENRHMNKETEEAVEALGGSLGGGDNVVAAGGAEDTTDYKAEFEKLQKQLQGERVEAGRLKKANEENAALRKRLEELEAQRGTEEAVNALPENLKELPDDYKQGAAALAKHMVDKANAARDAKMNEMEERFKAEEKRRRLEAMGSFVGRIEATFPGFLASIREGGDKKAAWVRYQRFNAATIKTALAESDFDTLSHHISQFYSSIGVAVPSGSQDGSAAPDPRSMGGGVQTQIPGGPGKTYSAEEYKRILDEAQTKFQSQQISYKDYSAICGELTKAYREGRVK